jgi:DNA-binding MarR family transcriptional regulator
MAATTELSRQEWAAYAALMRVVLASPRAVGADITEQCGLSLSDHLALQRLAETPDGQQRMTRLAVACGVSLSGICRIADRLDAAGLITRTRSAQDARGMLATLTQAGRDRLAQSGQVHPDSARRHIFAHLGPVDLALFAGCMDRIADSMLAGPRRE